MTLAVLSLAALVAALLVSCVSAINIGVLAIVLAWLVGVYGGGMRLEQVLAGFPVSLFVTLTGVTLLFAQALGNGTLEVIARHAVRLCRGVAGVIPMMFFVLTAAVSAIGPGNIAATALMAPLGMAAAGRYNVPPFLMAMMLATGASAGSVSPVAPTGIIVNGLVTTMGLPDARWTIFANNLAAHAAVAFAGYLLLGGWTLLRGGQRTPRPAVDDPNGKGSAGGPMPLTVVRVAAAAPREGAPAISAAAPGVTGVVPQDALNWRQWLTVAVIAALIVGTIVFEINVGMAAFAGALLLTLSRAADEKAAFTAMPWGVIVMVTGVTVLVSLLEKTGGMALFTAGLGSVATPKTAAAVTGFVTGLVSIYSSTTGVVLPAMLPIVPGVVQHMGGGDPMALVSSMVVGGHLVDVSPLSTLGALCLAAAPPGTDTRGLFNQLLAWGLSMTVVAALVCWVMFGT